MRIVVHDYSGHPFQVQLTRELASRGHHAIHLHCPSMSTGKGALERTAADPATFEVEGVSLGKPFAKYSPGRRFVQEVQYGRLMARRTAAFQPDVVISSNTPLVAQRVFMHGIRHLRSTFLFWQQDIYSVAIRDYLTKKLGRAGHALGYGFVGLERSMVKKSDAVVVISEDFTPVLDEWHIPAAQQHVIENWAPLGELPVRDRDNAWARVHGLVDKSVLLYSGTLGLKHNPELLLRLAQQYADRPDVRVVVNSEGPGADWLRERSDGLESLVLLGFQPYDALPDVFATADALITILEPEAGVFSVPSKVLSYHCSGRPLIAAVPPENLASRIIERNRTGIAVRPDDVDGLLRAADELLRQPELRTQLGQNARAYAERTFDIDSIADRFETVIEGCRQNGHTSPIAQPVAS